jgi:hypothetical protein
VAYYLWWPQRDSNPCLIAPEGVRYRVVFMVAGPRSEPTSDSHISSTALARACFSCVDIRRRSSDIQS